MKKYVLITIGIVLPSTLFAASIGEAYLSFEKGQYEQASVDFYDVLNQQKLSGGREEIEYGVAESLVRAGYKIASLNFFEKILRQGAKHSFFIRALEQVIDISYLDGMDIIVTPWFDSLYDRNLEALRQLNPLSLQRLHYLLAKRAFRAGKLEECNQFAQAISKESTDYAKAQYFQGLAALKLGSKSGKPDYEKTLQHFDLVLSAIRSSDDNSENQEVRDLAQIGKARVMYELAYAEQDAGARQKKMELTVGQYQLVPRFRPSFADALFERSWAFTVLGQYGDALGSLYSLTHPYFANRWYPEEDVLRASIYWYNCQWDRVNRTISGLEEKSMSTSQALKSLLQNAKSDSMLWRQYLDMKFPKEATQVIQGDNRILQLASLEIKTKNEVSQFGKSNIFASSLLGKTSIVGLERIQEDIGLAASQLIRSDLLKFINQLDDIMTRATLISLETKTAEASWLSAGKQTEGQLRKRLARPFIPEDAFQFWWQRGEEKWLDELGYYKFTVESECYE